MSCKRRQAGALQMEPVTVDANEELTRYLLGEMPEEEQTDFEMRYFSDAQLFGELCARRNNLIDSYVSGQLSTPMRERFEAGIDKSWAINERIRFAESLQGAIDTRAVGLVSTSRSRRGRIREWFSRLGSSYGRLIFVASILLILVGLGWLIFRSRHQDAPDGSEAGLESSSSPSSDDAANSPVQPRPNLTVSPGNSPTQTSDNPNSILTVPLSSDLEGTATDVRADVLVPANVAVVKLVLIIDQSQDANYTAVVTTSKDAEIFKEGSLKPHTNAAGRGVDLYVPANRLPDGDYVVRLSSLTANNETISAGKYYLRVRKN